MNTHIEKYRALFSLFILSGILVLFLTPVNEYVVFTSVGFFSVAVLLLPFALKRKQNILSTWTFFSLSVFLGCFVRGLYIAFEHPNNMVLDFYYFLGQPASYFYWPATLFISSLLLIALSYIYAPVHNVRPYFKKSDVFIRQDRLYLFAFVALIVSVISIALYIQFTGGFDSLSLSRKRSAIESLVLGKDHRTWQSLRIVASLAMLAHLFVLQDAIISNVNKLPKFVFAAILFIVAVFLPFYSSTRSDVVVYIIFSFLVFHSMGKRLPWNKALLYIIAAVFIFQLMSALRSSSELSISQLRENIFDTRMFDSIVINRNGAELGKTAHIVDAVPDVLSLQYGKTIGVWFLAPIPRELWNNKPLISVGPIIGSTIYGNRVSGVPPGFIGEMYWNFHAFGLLFGSIALGWLLKWLDKKFRPTVQSLAVFIYGPLQFGHFVIGVTLGYGVLNAAIKTVIAIVVFKLITQESSK